MGKGDRRTTKGQRILGTYVNSIKRKATPVSEAPKPKKKAAPKKADAAEKPAVKKAAVKKPAAAKKPAAKKAPAKTTAEKAPEVAEKTEAKNEE
jgi:hypothetical protein